MDVTNDQAIDAVAKTLGERWGAIEAFVHGVAFANKEDLEGAFVTTSRAGFQVALEVSAYSLLNVTNRLNVINFAGLFSGTAIAPPRSFAIRLHADF
jgi:enoyl-[acyl-carrier-protein] reductase (NADH)